MATTHDDIKLLKKINSKMKMFSQYLKNKAKL